MGYQDDHDIAAMERQRLGTEPGLAPEAVLPKTAHDAFDLICEHRFASELVADLFTSFSNEVQIDLFDSAVVGRVPPTSTQEVVRSAVLAEGISLAEWEANQ